MSSKDHFARDKHLAKLLGWTWDAKAICDPSGQRWPRHAGGEDQLRQVLPNYHTDGNDMLWLIYEMERRTERSPQEYEWHINSKQGFDTYDAAFYAPLSAGKSEGETIQETVCEAAIKALESEREDER